MKIQHRKVKRTAPLKNEIVRARITVDEKELLEVAAAQRGTTISGFIRDVVETAVAVELAA